MPAVIYTLVFAYYPMTGIVLAFKKYNYAGGIWGSPWNGFGNFKFFFQSGQAGLVMRNTVLYNIVLIVLNTVLQIAVALFLTEVRNKHFRKVSQSLLFLPYFISWVIVGVMAFNMFSSDYGIVNSIITTFGGAPKAGELVLYNTQDPTDTKPYYILDWDGFADYCKDVKEMADAGCWSPDVLNSTDDRQTGLLSGRTASMVWNMGSCRTYGRQANTENPDWNVTLVDPVASYPKQVNPYTNNGVAINVNSKNKERAMMVLNEFWSNPEVYDLAMFGIEGKHWEAVGDDQYKILDESNFGVANNCNWGWNNANLTRTEYIENRTALDDTFDAMKASWDANVKGEHPLDGFNFDSTNVSTQFAAVEANIDTYYNPLTNGLVDDVDASIAEFKQALEVAGMQDVMDEMNRQIEEYVAAK